MNLKSLPNPALHSHLQSLVSKERALTLEVLQVLREVERRRLYAERGFSSLHEYCLRQLGYSEGAAYRRISAMRLLRDLPETARERTEEALEMGRLSLSSVSTLQGYFQEKKREGNEITPAEKTDLLTRIEGKSKRETEEEIARRKPDRARRDQERPLNETETEIRFTADKELLGKLDRVRELLFHKHPYATYADLLEELAGFYLRRKDPMEQEEKPASMTSPARPKEFTPVMPPKSKNPRFIPARVRRAIHRKHQARCAYEDPQTKRQCNARHFLELDHIHPVAYGGSGEPGNLRLLCRTHNLLKAREAGLPPATKRPQAARL